MLAPSDFASRQALKWPQLQEDGTYAEFTEPAWMKRAKDPNNPSLGNASIKTRSQEVDGREVLYPTIRMQKDGTLKEYTDEEALKIALANKDYLLFTDDKKATEFAIHLSDRLGEIKDKHQRSLRRDP